MIIIVCLHCSHMWLSSDVECCSHVLIIDLSLKLIRATMGHTFGLRLLKCDKYGSNWYFYRWCFLLVSLCVYVVIAETSRGNY